MSLNTDITARFNLDIKLIDQYGNVQDERKVHNIFTNLGREWLTRLISYKTINPDVPNDDRRIKFIGLGIGGNKQNVNAEKIITSVSAAYPGTNIQTDTNPDIIGLERPIRVTGSLNTYPGSSDDNWIGEVQYPAVFPQANRVEFRRIFSRQEISYNNFTEVPISEAGLFLSDSPKNVFNNSAVAYDTFPTLTKTAAFQLEVVWTLIIA